MTARQANSRPVDVLIAEDDPVTRATLRTFLEMEGYRCAEAGDGWSAVELARRSPPRYAILDLVMPGMDGLALARRLRSDLRTRAMHLHCLTGVSDDSTRARAEEAGFDSYLTKPVDPTQLLCILRGEAGDA